MPQTGEELSAIPKCQIFEILQHTCPAGKDELGRPRFECFPIPRIFRICDGRPAIEVTRVVVLDPSNGEIDIPQDVEKLVPKAKTWPNVKLHSYFNPSGSQ